MNQCFNQYLWVQTQFWHMGEESRIVVVFPSVVFFFFLVLVQEVWGWEFFRRTHFCKNTGERRTFFAKIRALYGENTDKILVHVQSVIDLFAKQLNNALNLHYVYHQNTGVIRAIFHKCP